MGDGVEMVVDEGVGVGVDEDGVGVGVEQVVDGVGVDEVELSVMVLMPCPVVTVLVGLPLSLLLSSPFLMWKGLEYCMISGFFSSLMTIP